MTNETETKESEVEEQVSEEIETPEVQESEGESEEGKEIEIGENGKVEIPDLTEGEAKVILNGVKGIVFKVGEGYFEIKYINIGQRRFSATLINDIKG